jgi:hypothetical protein
MVLFTVPSFVESKIDRDEEEVLLLTVGVVTDDGENGEEEIRGKRVLKGARFRG